MDRAKIDHFSQQLYRALRDRTPVDPLLPQVPGMTIKDAYKISLGILDRRMADGERVVGKKIGVTGHAVQAMLGIDQPDFGFLTDVMWWKQGPIPVGATMMQPKAEAEIAFVLGRSLKGPGVTAQDVLDATESVAVCFEVVDSRVRDWKIRIQDTIADNASSGMFVLGDARIDPRGLDLASLEVVVEKNGELLSQGVGSASALGSPEACTAWLANTLGAFDIGLEAGEVILSGALVPLEPVVPGDVMKASIAGLGELVVEFG